MGYWPVQIIGNKFATSQILQKPVEVVTRQILFGWAQKSLEPYYKSNRLVTCYYYMLWHIAYPTYKSVYCNLSFIHSWFWVDFSNASNFLTFGHIHDYYYYYYYLDHLTQLFFKKELNYFELFFTQPAMNLWSSVLNWVKCYSNAQLQW